MLAQLVTNNWYAPWLSLRQFQVPSREYARWVMPAIALCPVVALAAWLARRVVSSMLGSHTRPVVALSSGVLLALVIVAPLAWGVLFSSDERAGVLGNLQGMLRGAPTA